MIPSSRPEVVAKDIVIPNAAIVAVTYASLAGELTKKLEDATEPFCKVALWRNQAEHKVAIAREVEEVAGMRNDRCVFQQCNGKFFV
jgi:hypothetical protein